MTVYHPALITEVAPESAAARCGLQVGDRLLAINGMPVQDAIDVRIYGGEPELEFLFEREGEQQTCEVGRRYGEPLGLNFSDVIFDGEPRRCHNNCDFCFVAQMAPGLRPSLYVKDDDYRLSFLQGNYITLTNLSEADWERIEDQYLSPLYVSVHATEPDVRVGLMHNPHAGAIMDHLQRLADAGIELHTQAVLVPGRNDGEHLDHTIADLTTLYPRVQDLSVVPVGLTRWLNKDLRPYTRNEAEAVLNRVLAWHTKLREELGVGFVYPSDEWFLRTQRPVPALSAYDGLLPAMIENGVGMVRHFLDTRSPLMTSLGRLGATRQTWVTGMLFAPTLQAFAEAFSDTTGCKVEVVPVINHFLGETVTVAGLLTAEDILDELAKHSLGDMVVMPAEIFRGPDGRTLDGIAPGSLALALDRPLVLATIEEGAWRLLAIH